MSALKGGSVCSGGADGAVELCSLLHDISCLCHALPTAGIVLKMVLCRLMNELF